MASNNITLNVKSRGKPISKLPRELSINPNATGPELYNAIAVKCGLSIHRIRITKASDGTAIHNSNNATIHSTGLRNQSTIYVKDLAGEPSTSSSLALFVFGQLANLNSHVVLRNLRRPGTSERGIPSGFGFSLVTCPNYLFEVIAWVGVYLVSGLNWSMVLFIVVACTPMIIWGKQKERAYRTEFGDKYKKKRSEGH
ncbi:predicted protein [Histoplasma mississippiense (nom. inval.)]|uniref:predicted protein n=1 Tax=Ajellomyces capsulatus (strain NAm1 / WU24) TaxID=2059318 RepID=UPI000157B9CC|nr:predicted protein [Histoplasma mississippiense (nom. inval.)]EDN03805.1 predicted protein [Histoplasma mississippiense (nom. inval.)]